MPNQLSEIQEDELVLRLQQAFYYGEGDIFGAVSKIIAPLQNLDSSELLESAVHSVQFDLAERRRYICSELFIDPERIGREMQDLIVKSLSTVKAGESVAEKIQSLGGKLGIGQLKQANLSPQLSEQIQLYINVSKNLNNYFEGKAIVEEVASPYQTLKGLPSKKLEEIYSLISQLFNSLAAYGDSPPLTQITLPKALTSTLEQERLSTKLVTAESLGQQLKYLVTLKRCIEAINAVTRGEIDEDSARKAVAQFLVHFM